MKKIKKYITLIILGGVAVLSIALINGWRLDDYTIPKNRTREQYDFEGTFEPMFTFLEQENIDLTGIKSYSVSVSIGDREKQKESYEVFLNSKNNLVDGSYTIRKDENTQEVHVSYENSQLLYSDSINPKFDKEIFNLSIKREYFEALEVKEVFRSSEKALSNIIYKTDDNSELFNKLVKKYNFSKNAKCFVSITHSSGNAYNIAIVLEDDNKSIQIDKYISIMKGEANELD